MQISQNLETAMSETLFTKALQTTDVQVSCEKVILYRKNTKPQKQVDVKHHKIYKLYTTM